MHLFFMTYIIFYCECFKFVVCGHNLGGVLYYLVLFLTLLAF